jgi:hypothetical protein
MKLGKSVKLAATSQLGPVAICDDVIPDYAFQILLDGQLVLDAQRKKVQVILVLQIKIYLSQFSTCVLM